MDHIDHNYISLAIFGLTMVMAVLGVLIRGWFSHVNLNLVNLWERIDAEAKARQDRWDNLHEKCEVHSAAIAELKGRLNGKAKVLGALGRSEA